MLFPALQRISLRADVRAFVLSRDEGWSFLSTTTECSDTYQYIWQYLATDTYTRAYQKCRYQTKRESIVLTSFCRPSFLRTANVLGQILEQQQEHHTVLPKLRKIIPSHGLSYHVSCISYHAVRISYHESNITYLASHPVFDFFSSLTRCWSIAGFHLLLGGSKTK